MKGTQWEEVVRAVHWGRAHEDQRKRKVAKPVACYTCRLTKHYQKTLHYRLSVSFLQAAASLSQEDGSRMPP